MAEQEITNDELARMIKGGFDAVGKDVAELKTDVGQLKTDVGQFKIDVENRFDKIDVRLDRIELMAFGDYKRRIERRLEDQVKELIGAAIA